MRSDSTDQRAYARLTDGRRLGYAETGPRDGVPVVYCHGAIGTPLGGSLDLDAIAWGLGVRHISVSRPGVGGSDPAPGRTLVDFGADLAELLGVLGIERFSLVGVSAGGPYALAVARELPDRVERLALCSSLSPLCELHRTPGMRLRIRLALRLLARAPRLCAAVGNTFVPLVRSHPQLLSRIIAAHAASSERERLARPEERDAASASFLDATEGGVTGLIEDYLTYGGAWGFVPGEVRSEVHLWHGLNDPLVPIDHALELAMALPRCRVFFDPDEGHHFFRRRLGEILAVLVGRRVEPSAGVATSLASARALAAGRGTAG
jgi:pimeloyl-ACP methyl ester carboxylesterase